MILVEAPGLLPQWKSQHVQSWRSFNDLSVLGGRRESHSDEPCIGRRLAGRSSTCRQEGVILVPRVKQSSGEQQAARSTDKSQIDRVTYDRTL
jgi:hypothetical protein